LSKVAIDTRPLRIKDFRRLVVGQGLGFVGSMLTQVAVPVQVYAISHSSLMVGLVSFVGLIPLIGFGLYGGTIADVVDRRRLSLLASLLTWLVTIGLLLAALAGTRSVLLLMALVAVQSAGFAMASSARGAITPRIVPTELVPAANTLNFTVSNVGQVVGPLIGGALIGLSHGFALAYGTDALLFGATLYATYRLPPIPPPEDRTRAGLRSLLEGLRFISTEPILLVSFMVDIIAMVLANPRALYPEVADDRFGGNVGPLFAAIAIGAVLGGLTSGWIGRVRRQGVALTAAVAAWGLIVAAAGLAHTEAVMVLLLASAGAADLVASVYRQTILQTFAPDRMRGRMQGVFIVVVAGGPRLGDVRAGVTASAVGSTLSWVGGGLACTVAVVVLALWAKSFWRYDASRWRADHPAPAETLVLKGIQPEPEMDEGGEAASLRTSN
jgi:MFS family permease